jgi:hypothetical protein
MQFCPNQQVNSSLYEFKCFHLLLHAFGGGYQPLPPLGDLQIFTGHGRAVYSNTYGLLFCILSGKWLQS